MKEEYSRKKDSYGDDEDGPGIIPSRDGCVCIGKLFEME
jgi:hypothetical protein